MPPSISVPLEVLGLGAVISYAIAALIKVLLICIRKMTKSPAENNAVK